MWGRRSRLPSSFVFAALVLHAQDLHSLRSPDRNVEFRLFVTQDKQAIVPGIAYSVFYKGKPLLETSYMAFDLYDQEPLLGEKAGLMNWTSSPGVLIAHYMQDGSIGRRIDVEVRAWDDGVAFRYVIPRTTPVEDLQMVSELPEFAMPVKVESAIQVPFTQEIPGGGWGWIGEKGTAGSYPEMSLEREDDPKVLTTHFRKLWQSVTPLTTPWRVIGIGDSAERAATSADSFRP